MSEWQKIDTAPIDKKIIGCWLGAEGCEEIDLTVLCDALNEPPFWCSSHSLLERYTAPDYWMPLPLPPNDPR